MASTPVLSPIRSTQRWYRPTVSPEHGVYVILLVSFLTGVAAAQQWTWATSLALVCAFSAFQAEHPLVLQIKQHSSLKPCLLLWAGLYSGVAGAIALWLLWQSQNRLPLLLLYGSVALALSVDMAFVRRRRQRAIANELVTFFAVCLSAPLAYAATVEELSPNILALWVLNGLFFSSAIFTVKLRKVKTASVLPGIIFHCAAVVVVLVLGWSGWLAPVTAAAFGIVVLKFGLVLWQKDWYCTAKIKWVAALETTTSLLFLSIVTLSLLPAHLPAPQF